MPICQALLRQLPIQPSVKLSTRLSLGLLKFIAHALQWPEMWGQVRACNIPTPYRYWPRAAFKHNPCSSMTGNAGNKVIGIVWPSVHQCEFLTDENPRINQIVSGRRIFWRKADRGRFRHRANLYIVTISLYSENRTKSAKIKSVGSFHDQPVGQNVGQHYR